MKSKHFWLLPALILLLSCTSTQVIDKEVPKPLGQEPSPISIPEVNWIVDDNKVSLTPADGVKLNKQLKDTITYIKQLQNLTCYERNEYSFCKKEQINE